MLAAYEDKSAYALCVFSFSRGPEHEPITFEGRTEVSYIGTYRTIMLFLTTIVTQGKIVPARGPTNFGWDPVFEPAGYDKTYAELDKEVKNSISHRYRSLAKLKEYLLQNTHLLEKH